MQIYANVHMYMYILLIFLFELLNEVALHYMLYEEQKHILPDSFFVDHNVA